MSREELIQQQRELQNKLTEGWVVVFPSTGMCSYCGADLIQSYTPLEMSRDFISGCRKCHKSYVD